LFLTTLVAKAGEVVLATTALTEAKVLLLLLCMYMLLLLTLVMLLMLLSTGEMFDDAVDEVIFPLELVLFVIKERFRLKLRSLSFS